jgi:putative ABC transport system permease protein
MRIRLKIDRLQQILAQSTLSQNHWAIRLGLSKGHLSNLLSGKHPYPSARTRERMLEVLNVPFDDLFEVEKGTEMPDHPVQKALADHYIVDRLVGQGGMGTVYQARDLRLGRVVAIKIVNAEAVSGVGSSTLLREIVHTNRLQHHNILPVLDIGEAEGSPFYVMPHVRGGSLANLLKEQGRLPVWRVLSIMGGVASALDHAHRNGILHCDVKPANVLLSDDHAYLADFGIARVIQSEVWSGEWRAEYDSGAGTPAYVSPEQARGDPDIDARSDVYSMACMVFEMLTGSPPFEGPTTLATVAKRFQGEPPRITAIAPGLSPGLSDAIYRAMAVDRDARTPSATRFFEECRKALVKTGSITGVSVSHETHGVATRPPIREKLNGILQDIRFALRGIARAPAFAIAVALTLGLGIGANAVMFGLIDRLLLRPPEHVTSPETVKRLYVSRSLSGQQLQVESQAWQDIEDFRRAKSFSSVAAYFNTRLPADRGSQAAEINGVLTTANYFQLLGVTPFRGRFFSPEDDVTGAAGTVILSHAYWKKRFNGSNDAIGQVLRLGRGSYTVIGIAPQGFTGINLQRVDVFLPLAAAAHETIGGDWQTSRGFYWVRGIARLAPGATVAAAESETTTLHRAGRAESRGYDRNATVIVAPVLEGRGPKAAKEVKVSVWLAGVSLILLIIACANVMNLILARLTHRDRELAVRVALGAGRARLVGQLVTETVVLALIAATTGLLLAQWGGTVLQRTLIPEVTWASPLTDWRVVTFTLLVTLMAGLVSGIIPAWKSSRPDLATSLKVGRGGPGTHRSQLRSTLLVFQASLSVILLIGAGLFVKSIGLIRSMDTGMDLHLLVVASVDLKAAGYTPADAANVQRDVMEQITLLPGVAGVTASHSVPFWSSWSEDFKALGVDSMPTLPGGGPYINAVAPQYFEVMGTPIIKGRGLTDADRAGSARVAVLGQTMARLIWQGQDPIGRCIIIGADSMPCTEVVGIAADVPRQQLLEREDAQYYVPAEQIKPNEPFEALFVRSTGDAQSIAQPVHRILTGISPDLPFVDVRPLWDLTDQQTRSWNLGATLFTIFGGLAMIVAAIGLYSVLSFSVARRTQEFGVRGALGATMGSIVGLVLRGGMRLVLIGIGIGFAVALLSGRWLAPLLYQTSPRDPVVFGSVAVVLLLSAAIACLIPAIRATRITPMEALRSE